jgi:hypothetical protein
VHASLRRLKSRKRQRPTRWNRSGFKTHPNREAWRSEEFVSERYVRPLRCVGDAGGEPEWLDEDLAARALPKLAQLQS